MVLQHESSIFSRKAGIKEVLAFSRECGRAAAVRLRVGLAPGLFGYTASGSVPGAVTCCGPIAPWAHLDPHLRQDVSPESTDPGPQAGLAPVNGQLVTHASRVLVLLYCVPDTT